MLIVEFLAIRFLRFRRTMSNIHYSMLSSMNLSLVTRILTKLCSLLLVLKSFAFGNSAQEEGWLVLLPCSAIISKDVLFNMQTRRMEEVIYLASSSERTLVEPYYLYGARNWSWFEQNPHSDDFNEGIFGIIQEPLGDYFQLDPISALLGSPIQAMPDFVSSTGGALDLVIRFFTSSEEDCQIEGAAVDAYGEHWIGEQLICLDVRSLRSLDPLLRLLRDKGRFPRVGLHYMPPKLVELRYPAWRDSAPRNAVSSRCRRILLSGAGRSLRLRYQYCGACLPIGRAVYGVRRPSASSGLVLGCSARLTLPICVGVRRDAADP